MKTAPRAVWLAAGAGRLGAMFDDAGARTAVS
jgi:hypothetical protein